MLKNADTLRVLGRPVEDRSALFGWMIRVAERCRMSVDAWHRAQMLLDRSRVKANQYHKAAACMYLSSKFVDEKYLVAEVFLEGVLLT